MPNIYPSPSVVDEKSQNNVDHYTTDRDGDSSTTYNDRIMVNYKRTTS